MNARWGLYVAAFVVGVVLIVAGLSMGNTTLTLAGVIIGFVLFLTRRRIE